MICRLLGSTRGRANGWRFVAVLAALLISAPSFADEITEARRAFVSGMKHFDLGEYRPALEDFKNGYRAKEDPVFLYNIAQCYRMLNENQDAIRYYRLYLSRAPDASNRSEIEDRLVKLQELVSQEEKSRPASPAPAMQALRTPNAAAAANTLTASRPTAAAKTPIYKKWWLWTIVGVVAVGAGVGLGVGLTHSSSSSGTTFPTAGF